MLDVQNRSLTLCSCTICCSRRFCSLRACANPSGHEIIEIFVVCDGVLIVRIDVGCALPTMVRDVLVLFGSINFEFIVFGEMLSERTFDMVCMSAMHGGGFELNELCRRRYSGIVDTIPFPFGTGAVVDIN